MVQNPEDHIVLHPMAVSPLLNAVSTAHALAMVDSQA